MSTYWSHTVTFTGGASAIFALSVALLFNSPVQCQTYAVFDVPGATSTDAYAINATGAVTGTYMNAGVPHGYIRDALGNITMFDVPGATLGTTPASINNGGAIVGYYNDARGAHGFLRRPAGSIVSFDAPAATGTVPTAVSGLGTITGYYSDSAGTHGFVRDSKGVMTSFDLPGVSSTTPYAINQGGSITGYYTDAKGTHGFVRSAQGAFTSFDAPGSRLTMAFSINLWGSVTGYYRDKGGHFFGFVFSGSGDPDLRPGRCVHLCPGHQCVGSCDRLLCRFGRGLRLCSRRQGCPSSIFGSGRIFNSTFRDQCDGQCRWKLC